ncbi:ankycorbin-like isoform X2 [Leptopilina heterotoma]|uniref:ankycorbin-like isoform X2 n=1 Tax=Leptopilina heterotoma TaxID=63436 RepID=UPI001CA9EF0A|nr:ankycorbin-like isoform X2 [Leptopilina heterotoma]
MKYYDDTPDYHDLFLVVQNGQLHLVQSLLEKYSLTEKMCSRTLLHMAAARGHVEIAKLFTTQGDGIVNTQLHLAINGNQPEYKMENCILFNLCSRNIL